MTSVAMLSRAAGPPWADGAINTHVAWARTLPDYEFRWFASTAWTPAEPNFRAGGRGASDNSWDARQKLRFAAWLTTTQADLFHLVFFPQPATLKLVRPLLALKRRPLVQTVQTAFAAATPIAPLLVTRHLLAVTERIARELVAVNPDADVTVVHPAVERSLVDAGPIAPARAEHVHRELGVAAGRRFVLYAGNWSEALGVLEALEIFATFAAGAPDVDLVVANRVSLRSGHATPEARVRATFDARVREMGLGSRVRVVGLLPEFRAVIAASAALLFPALDLRDGKLDLPLVVPEAIALGVPIAIYAIPPFDEFAFAPAGAVAPVSDRAGVGAQLGALLTDSVAWSRASDAGRALARDAFDPASRAPLLRGIYERAQADR